MLSTEILIFDVAFGQPLGSIPLPKKFKPFKKLLGVYGHSTSYGGGSTGGIDVIYALHEDDVLTSWNRGSELLTFSLGSSSKLISKPLRGLSVMPLHIMTSCGCIWHKSDAGGMEIDCTSAKEKASENRGIPKKSLLIVNVMSNGQVWRWNAAIPYHTLAAIAPQKEAEDLIDLKQWDSENEVGALIEQLDDSNKPSASQEPEAETRAESSKDRQSSHLKTRPELEQILCSLTGSVTHISLLPVCIGEGKLSSHDKRSIQNSGQSLDNEARPGDGIFQKVEEKQEVEGIVSEEEMPQLTPRMSLEPSRDKGVTRAAVSTTGGSRMPIAAAVTSTGSLEILSLEKGCLTAVHPKIIRSYAVHEARCRSVRWIGNGPLVVSFSSEKVDSLWKNVIVVTDVRTGETVPFRTTAPETAAMLGIRASPGGKYIVVLLKDAPAEIWLVTDLWNVKRVRHLEIPFTAVDWTLPETQPLPILNKDWVADEGEVAEQLPLETLVFTVSDGRVGSISLQGKKVINSKVRLPGWTNFGPASSSGRCISIAAIGSLVFLGDYDGNLIKWDLDSGKCETVFTDSGPVRRILPNPYSRSGTPSVRLAILSSTWKCSIYDSDERGKLFRSGAHSSLRLTDIAWIPSLHASGIATMLSGITEEGNVIVVEAEVPDSLGRHFDRTSFETNVLGKKKEMDFSEAIMDELSGHATVATTLALPKVLILLIRLLLQAGVPRSALAAAFDPESFDGEASALEDQIWNALPVNLRGLGSNGDRQSPQPPSTWSVSSQSSETPKQSRGVADDKGMSDAKKRARRRVALEEVSRGMSLATEVLKNIEAQNMRSKGILGRVRGRFSRNQNKTKESSFYENDLMVETSEASRQWQTSESLLDLLSALSLLRCNGRLLLPEEWSAYEKALEENSIISRMIVAALVSGDSAEVEFWRHLSATLAIVRDRAFPKATGAAVQGTSLWDDASFVATARARAKLHDGIPRSHIEAHPELQEQRLLEYVSLGDYHTAVGFLLSSAPEASARYYRDSLCAYALSSVGTADSPSNATGSPNHAQERSSLHLQVAKVVSAHAASMGDSLLGVPLLCTAGLHHEAVSLLQDAGLWSYASILMASMLDGPHYAISCLRWAQYVWKYEGSLWRAAGILTAGGCLREAAQVLLDAGYVDCAAAYCLACEEFDLTVPLGGVDESLTQLYSALPSNQLVRVSSVKATLHSSRSAVDEDLTKYSMTSIMNSYNDYVTAILTGL